MSLRRLTVLAVVLTPMVALLGACDDGGDTPSADATTSEDAAVDTSGAADTSASADTTQATADTVAPQDSTVADTTSPQDTTAPQDTTPVDMGEGTCPGIRACVAGCAGAADSAQCETDCLAAADSAAEADAYTALASCLSEKACDEGATSDDDFKQLYECYRQCLPQIATCSAGSFGDDNCAAISGCMAGSCYEGDFRCARSCMSAASEQAVQQFLDWDYCSKSQCYNSTDIIAFETCVQQVRSEVVCTDPYSECFTTTTGAGPGAGAGGGE